MDCREGSLGDDGGKSTGFISHHEEEWRLVGYGVRAVIVGELGKGNVLSPGSGVRAAEDPKISFYFLVHMLGFPVSLRVIGGGEGKFVAEEFSQLFSESRGKLWSSIQDDFIIETKSFKNFGEEQGGDSGSINGFLGRAENYPLSKPMVDHDQKGIKTIRKGQVGDQVTGDLLKGAKAGGRNGEKWGTGWVSVDLVLLTRGATLNITPDIRGKPSHQNSEETSWQVLRTPR